MNIQRSAFAAVFAPALLIAVVPAGSAQQPGHDAHDGDPDSAQMWMTMLPGGWHLMGMAHVFPAATFAAPFASESPLNRTDLTFPHGALMGQLVSPDSRWVFKFMPNFEGLTLPEGDPALGGWGEGFIDARHPHTLLHEAMLSFNWWEAPGGAFSVSAGRGFTPYGTEDPMYRPALKYPTNHHLSQILERWTVNVAYLTDAGLGVELGVFDGDEPEDAWDISNIGNFGNSWSGRLSYRFGAAGAAAPWELSASYGRVRETHGDGEDTDLTVLYNAALRHEARYGFGQVYGLAELSISDPEDGEGYFSLLGETELGLGPGSRHRPFYRIELATRPEYPREATAGADFFRYDHDAEAIGATRWLINTAGYGFDLTDLPLSARPFLEVSHNRVRHERGPESLAPENLFGGDSFWSLTTGVRLFLGGGPMRMGMYGVVDPMTRSMRGTEMPHSPEPEPHHEHPMPDHDVHEPEHEHHEPTPEDHAMADDPGMHRAMALVVRLLDDPEVQRRIHAVHEYHEVWQDPAVQRSIDTLREMHREEPHRHAEQPDRSDMHALMDEPGMQRAMSLVIRLLDDPEVQRRIHTVHEYHEVWQDPSVQQHIEMMRRMHGGEDGGRHPRHDDHVPPPADRTACSPPSTTDHA